MGGAAIFADVLTTHGRIGDRNVAAARAAVEWSIDLLSENEQLLFRRLSVFVGGGTLEAVEAVEASAEGAHREGGNVIINGEQYKRRCLCRKV